MSLTVEAVQAALKGLIDPNTQIDFVTSKSVKNLRVDGGDVSLDIVLGYPAKSQFDGIRKSVIAVLRELPEVKNVSVNVSSQIVAHSVQRGVKLLPNVKIESSMSIGIQPDAKEAILFAVLANEAVAGTPLLAGGNATKIPITMGKFSFPE